MVFQAYWTERLRDLFGRAKPLFDSLLFIYYNLVYLAFDIFNSFKKKETVPPPTDPLLLLSATILSEKIRSREVTSVEVVNAYINRIKEVNPIINAVVNDNFEEALQRAKELDKNLDSMELIDIDQLADTKPLYGLPFTMKDSISAKGKVITCGTYAYRNHICEDNAVCVQRMLDAGAILLTITNVPVNCMWVEASNAIFGRTNNPYDTRRHVGGSSGGEGALHGAGASLMGIGSDIGGSIRIPSAMNGVFGQIHTPQLIPDAGHVPPVEEGTLKFEMQRIGPITRFAEDLPLISQVIAGSQRNKREKKSLENVKFFYGFGPECATAEPLSKECKDGLVKVVRHLERKLGILAQPLEIPETESATDLFFNSFKESVDEPLMADCLDDPYGDKNTRYSTRKLFQELFNYFRGTSQQSLAMIIEALLDITEPYSPKEKKRLDKLRTDLRNRLIEILGEDGFLLWPTWPTTASFHHELLFKAPSTNYTCLWNSLAMIAASCPIGLSQEGLPLAVQIIGAPGSDALLQAISLEISNGFGGWVPSGRKNE